MTRRPTRALPALLLLALLPLATACGDDAGSEALPSAGGSAEASEDPTDPPSLDPEDAMLKYAQCMRDHGVDMPDPQPGGGVMIDGKGLDREAMEAAEEACEEYREAAMPRDREAPQLTAEEKQQFLDMAACMRERGWDFEDPTFGDDGGVQQRLDKESGIDPEDPAFQADVEECHTEAGLEPPGAAGETRKDG